jgi:hypothetical protein
LVWACTETGIKQIPKTALYINLGTTRLTGRPKNRWQDEVRENGRIDGGEGWQEKVHNREEWKKLLRTARNHRILHMPMEWNVTDFRKSVRIIVYTFICLKKRHHLVKAEKMEGRGCLS